MPEFTPSPLSVVNQIKSNLQDRYDPGYPILKELLQNADDAGARCFRLDARCGWSKAANPLLRGQGLLAVNDGVFREEDERGILTFGVSVKASDHQAIGKFGLGQKAVFHLCDAFVVHAFDGDEQECFSTVVNPFLNVDVQKNVTSHWDDLSECDVELLRHAASDFGAHGLVLWLPFRSERLQPAPGVAFSSITPSISATLDQLARTEDLQVLLTMLRHLESIEIRKQDTQDPRPVTRCVVRVADYQTRPRGPQSSRREPQPLRGTITTGVEHAAETTPFVGRETTRPNDRLADLQRSDHWPKVVTVLDAEPKREKGEPHGAATLLRTTAHPGLLPNELTISWAVFLPISAQEDTRLPLRRRAAAGGFDDGSALGRFRLLLHGYFFLDSGRRRIAGLRQPAPTGDPSSDNELHRAWNAELRDSVVLPLIPAVLNDAIDSKMVTADEMESLIAAVAASTWFDLNRTGICKDNAFVRELTAEEVATWRLVPTGTVLRPLPRIVADAPKRLENLFAGVLDWARDRDVVLCIDPDACLTRDALLWTPEELDSLFSRLSPGAFQSPPALASLLGELLNAVQTDEDRRCVTPHVVRCLRQALIETASLAPSERIRDILRLGASDARLVALPQSVEHRQVLRTLASAETEALPIRQAWRPEGQSPPRVSTTDLHALLSALAPLVADGGNLADQAATAALHLLQRSNTRLGDLAGHAQFADITVLRARDFRDEDKQVVALSLKTLVEKSQAGLLFERSPDAYRLLPLVVAALPETTPIMVWGEIAARLKDDAESDVQLRSARKNDILTLVSECTRFGPDTARARLLVALTPTVSDDPDALRRLCAGSPSAGPPGARLQILEAACDGIERIVKDLLQRRENDFLVPPCIADELTQGVRVHLGVQVLDTAALEDLLETHVEVFSSLKPTRLECEALLRIDLSRDLLRSLPIHARSDGVLVCAERCFLSDDRIPQAMRGIVWTVQLYEEPAARAKQKQLVRAWSSEYQIRTALDQRSPSTFCIEVLDALAEVSSRTVRLPQLFIDDLKAKSWLRVKDAPIAPEDVLHLPGSIAEPASNLLAEQGETRRFILRDQLPKDIRQHPGFSFAEKHLLPDRDSSLEALGRLIEAARLPGRLGSIEEYPIDDFVTLATNGIDLPLPGWPLLGAVLSSEPDGSDRESIQRFAVRLAQLSSADAAVAGHILDALAARAATRNRTGEAARRAYEHGFDAVAKWPDDARREVFGGTRVPTRTGVWRPGREVVEAGDGVADSHLLDPTYASKIGTRPVQPGGRKAEIDTDTGHDDEVISDDLAAIEAKCVTAHREFLSAWRGRVPSDLVLVYLGLIGRYPAMRELAGEWVADSTDRDVDVCWERLDHALKPTLQADTGPNPLRARVESRRFLIRETTGKTVRAVALSGDMCDVPVDETDSEILVGNLHQRCTRYKHRRVIRGADGARKLIIDLQLRRIDPASLDRRDLLVLFRQYVETMAVDCLLLHMEEPRHALEGVLDRACRVEQATVDDTKLLLRDRLPTILAQMKLAADSACFEALREYQDEETRLCGLPKATLEARDDLKAELWTRVHEAAAPAELLAGLRSRIKDLGYSADRILFELFQNADDACRQLDESEPASDEGECFRVETRSADHGGFRIVHWGRRINDRGAIREEGRRLGRDRDLLNMLVMDFSEKPIDRDLTGKFGLGFKSVHIVSDSVGIASGFIALRTCGGFLPTAWADGIDEARKYSRDDGRQATVIDVPFAEHAADDGVRSQQAFRRAMTWLPAFSRKIRRIEGDLGSIRCETRPLPGCPTGTIDTITVSETPERAHRALRFRLGDGYSLLLRIGSTGPACFPKTVQRLWNLAPLEEELRSGWLLNGPFAVDPGRGRLAGSIESRERRFRQLGSALGMRLLELYDLTAADWSAFATALDLDASEPVARPRFWKQLFDVVSRDFDGDLGQFLHARDRGYGHLAAERPVVPTGLAEPFGGPVSAAGVDRCTGGALAESDVLQRVRDWRALNDLTGHIVSSRVADQLNKLGFGSMPPMTLADLLREEMGTERRIDVELGTRLGEVVTPSAIENSLVRERNEILDAARQAKFRAQDGAWRPVRELNCDAYGDEEALICGFAPPQTLLHRNYVGASLDFFKVARARSGYGRNVSLLWEWANRAGDEDSRRAVLKYVIDGRQNRALAAELRKDRPSWLPQNEKLIEDPLLTDWTDEDKKRLLIMLGGHRRLTTANDPDPMLPATVAGRVLEAIHAWWRESGTGEREAYAHRAYPERFSPSRLRASDDRTAWFTMFALACYQSLGRTQDEQHRGFIGPGIRDGWWQDLARSRPPADVQPWLARLERWSVPEALKQDFLPWKRTLVDLYTVARHLDTYIHVFHILPRIICEHGPVSLRDAHRPTYWPKMERTRLDAAPLDRSLGIGANWMLRELVHYGVYDKDDEDLIAPYCWATTRRVRILLNNLQRRAFVESADMDASRSVYEFIKKHIGPDRARFDGDFDLPMQLVTRTAYRDVLRQCFDKTGSEPPDLDDSDDERGERFAGEGADE